MVKWQIKVLIAFCLSMILIDSVLKKNENYYPQVFLKECKSIIKEKMIERYIKDDLEISSDNSDKEISDKELFNLMYKSLLPF